MRVPLGWLSEWIDLPEPQRALEERLTLAGVEIEAVEQSGPDLSDIRVARVVERRPHPSADRLSLCKVDLGEGEPLDIVCGAPNVAAGQMVAVARPGTTLPDGTRLKKSKIRGVVSHGMICSERELGLGHAHEGILVLDPAAETGAPLSSVIRAGETVLDVEITPNRGDWSSMLGMARETRALFGGRLRIPACDPPECTRPAASDIRVEIEDSGGCYRYVARVVRGVKMGPSPDWLAVRLEAVGMRSINVLVDVTNLVLLEFGQPLHAFDLGTLRGGEIRVRSAREGEKLVTLDGLTRELEPEDLVIADAERAIALAGVMGGAETEVRSGTTGVLIESAHFHPSRIRRTARRLGLHSEASFRFERGVDHAGIQRAADRCARLISELAGGEVSQGSVEATGDPFAHCDEVVLDTELPNRLLGTSLSTEEVTSLLARVDVRSELGADGRLHCQIPSHRNDIGIPEDLVEEVARIHGYDRIPTTLPLGPITPLVEPPQVALDEAARDGAKLAGLVETRSFPGMREDDADRLRLSGDDPRRNALRILNPIVEDEPLLPTTLVPSLLRATRRNLARQVEQVRLFEVASVFRRTGPELPDEPRHLVAVLTRGERSSLWDAPEPAPLFFELKGIAQRLLLDQGHAARFEAGSSEPFLHPGASGQFLAGKVVLGHVGELHPEVAAGFEIDVPCGVIQLDLDQILSLPQEPPRFSNVSPYPLARRDIAILLSSDQPVGEVLEAIRKSGGKHLVAVSVFDRYRGKGVPEGKISIAFRLVFQRPDRTLTDAEVAKMNDRVVQMLVHRFGGQQR
ncbi:MAG: phenylalanine--tRNA ligase subunit beta [Myxococcota bacterium]